MDERFINAAMHTHGNSVLRAAMSITGNKQDAEDVFSDVFLALFRRRAEFESDNHLKAWLIRVATNKAKNIRLSAWSRRRRTLDENIPYIQPDTHSEVFDALKMLKPKERVVVYLYYYEGYSQREIATMLRLREGSVRSLISRARVSLKDILSE